MICITSFTHFSQALDFLSNGLKILFGFSTVLYVCMVSSCMSLNTPSFLLSYSLEAVHVGSICVFCMWTMGE